MYYLNNVPTSTSSRTRFLKHVFLPLPPPFSHLAVTSIDITRWVNPLNPEIARSTLKERPRFVASPNWGMDHECSICLSNIYTTESPRKFKSVPLKIGRHPKRKGLSFNYHFSGAMSNFGGARPPRCDSAQWERPICNPNVHSLWLVKSNQIEASQRAYHYGDHSTAPSHRTCSDATLPNPS